jgi:hypothetical protein
LPRPKRGVGYDYPGIERGGSGNVDHGPRNGRDWYSEPCSDMTGGQACRSDVQSSPARTVPARLAGYHDVAFGRSEDVESMYESRGLMAGHGIGAAGSEDSGRAEQVPSTSVAVYLAGQVGQ